MEINFLSFVNPPLSTSAARSSNNRKEHNMVGKAVIGRLSRVTSSGRYLPEVDGLRFVAIMPVLVQHLSERVQRYSPVVWSQPLEQSSTAFMASRGTVGVFLFFAISGFILCLPFAKHHLQGGKSIPMRAYLLRRLTRLEPPYLFWMTFFLLVLLAQGGLLSELLPHWLASIFYLHNILYTDYTPINPVAWSLEIEVQFYLLAPFLAGLFFRVKNKLRRRALLIAAIFGFISVQHWLGWAHSPYKLSLLGQLQHFLVGFLLVDFYLCDWQGGKLRQYAWLDAVAVLSFVVLCLSWSEEYGKSLVFTLALTSLLIAAFRGRFFPRLLRLPWVAVIGGMCYTIYLVHLPLMEGLVRFSSQLHLTQHFALNLLLQAAIVLPVILAFSALAFLLLEKPFMNKHWPMALRQKCAELTLAHRPKN